MCEFVIPSKGLITVFHNEESFRCFHDEEKNVTFTIQHHTKQKQHRLDTTETSNLLMISVQARKRKQKRIGGGLKWS